MERTEAFRVLASADRQLVLHELEAKGSIALGELSRRVAARRHRVSSDRIGDEAVARAHVRLVHIHLPQLADRDVVTVDWSDREVTLADDDGAEQVFEAAGELENWPPDDLLERPPS